jgi:hypothetical protein
MNNTVSCTANFGDARVNRSYEALKSKMLHRHSATIHELSEDRNERDRYYYLLNSEKFVLADLKNKLYNEVEEQAKDKVILVLQDTTEINYQNKRGRITDKTDLGLIGNNKDLGYFAHCSLAVADDAKKGTNEILGVIDVLTWGRAEERKTCTKNETAKKAFVEKERARWLTCAQTVAGRLESAKEVIFVQDREGDVYESMESMTKNEMKFIIRSSYDRVCFLDNKELKINVILSGKLPLMHKVISIKGSSKRTKREATLEIKYSQLEIKRPQRKSLKDISPKLNITIIEAKEILSDDVKLKDGEKPICWKILTNCDIQNTKDILTCLARYCKRWTIEELFKTLKSNCLNLEEACLETGAALLKLGIMALDVAQKVLALKNSGLNNPDEPVGDFFDTEELEFLETVITKHTKLSAASCQNPYAPHTMGWAYWLIGRLGSWDGYMGPKKKLRPGTRALSNGFMRFNTLFMGYKMAKLVFRKD